MLRPVSFQAPNVPEATLVRTLSVERPSHAYSPIVNGSGAVGRKMRQPIARHHLIQNESGTLAKQVRAIHQDDTGSVGTRLQDQFRALSNVPSDDLRTRGWNCGRRHENFIGDRQTVAGRQWMDFQHRPIEPLRSQFNPSRPHDPLFLKILR